MTNKLNSDVVISLKTYEDLVAKLNRDSMDMFTALDLKNRTEEISQEQYQAYLVHHLLITATNLTANLTDHLEWLKMNVNIGSEMSTEKILQEINNLQDIVDSFVFESYPPTHFKDVEEFINELQELKKEEAE